MGHSLASIEISTETADRIRTDVRARSRRDWFGGVGSFESEMVRTAVSEWRETDADRYDSENAGSGFSAPLLPRRAVGRYIDDNLNRVSHESVVIPVIRDQDVHERKVKVVIPLTAEQLAAVRAKNGRMTDYLWNALGAQFSHELVDASVTRMPAARKPQATVTSGATRTVYDVLGADNWGRRDVVLATEDTIALARAAAIRIMSDDERQPKLTVRGRVIRVGEDGTATAALVVIERPAAQDAAVTVEATLHTAKVGAIVSHYIVAFDYHH